jgi:DNA invertase Pin-like site-specific DNA recombinase
MLPELSNLGTPCVGSLNWTVFPGIDCTNRVDFQPLDRHIAETKNLFGQMGVSMLWGYGRVSTVDQDLSVQIAALKAAGVDENYIRTEKVSGTESKRAQRIELDFILKYIRAGDTLVVTRLDRLARSISDLKEIVRQLTEKGASLRVIEQPFDLTGAMGKMMLGILGVFAEFETDLRRDRQLEGIKNNKLSGAVSEKTGRLKYAGGVPTLDRAAILADLAAGMGVSAVARTHRVARQSVYNIKREAEGKAGSQAPA